MNSIQKVYAEKRRVDWEDLNEEQRKRVVEKYEVWDDWYESTIDYWTECLNGMGFIDPEIQFSGFWSQGDGASFTCEVDMEKLVSTIAYFQTCYSPWIDRYLEKEEGSVQVSFERFLSRYVHEKTVYLYWELCSEKFENYCEKAVESIDDFRVMLCRKIYESLKEDYEYQTSEECIKEYYEANEHDFARDFNLRGEMI